MQPDIKKFWEETAVVCKSSVDDSLLFYVVGSPKGDISSVVGRWVTIAKELNGEVIEYYYDNKTYSEKDMLRIIKLKAFL